MATQAWMYWSRRRESLLAQEPGQNFYVDDKALTYPRLFNFAGKWPHAVLINDTKTPCYTGDLKFTEAATYVLDTASHGTVYDCGWHPDSDYIAVAFYNFAIVTNYAHNKLYGYYLDTPHNHENFSLPCGIDTQNDYVVWGRGDRLQITTLGGDAVKTIDLPVATRGRSLWVNNGKVLWVGYSDDSTLAAYVTDLSNDSTTTLKTWAFAQAFDRTYHSFSVSADGAYVSVAYINTIYDDDGVHYTTETVLALFDGRAMALLSDTHKTSSNNGVDQLFTTICTPGGTAIAWLGQGTPEYNLTRAAGNADGWHFSGANMPYGRNAAVQGDARTYGWRNSVITPNMQSMIFAYQYDSDANEWGICYVHDSDAQGNADRVLVDYGKLGMQYKDDNGDTHPQPFYLIPRVGDDTLYFVYEDYGDSYHPKIKKVAFQWR